MTDPKLNEIYEQTHDALEDLFRDDPRDFRPIRLLLIGCSSSEIGGCVIGHCSSKEYGETVVTAVLDYCRETGAESEGGTERWIKRSYRS